MSWFPEGFEPYNNETILEPDGRIILLLHNPLVALSLILYTLLIIRLTADLAYECFCGVIEDFTEVCPNVFYYYHLVFNYINPAFWMSLSHAFLLSNWEILPSLCLVHLIFFTASVFLSTLAYSGSRHIIPVSTNIKQVPCHKMLVTYLTLTMICGELLIWCYYGKAEHPLIGKLFFFASLMAFAVSFLFHNRYTMADKFHVIQNQKIVQVMYRRGEDFEFKEYKKKKFYVYMLPTVEQLPV